MWLLYTFYFLMLLSPTVFQMQRGLLLPLLILGGVINLRRYYLSNYVLRASFITIVASVFFLLLGFFNNNPGASRIWTIYVMWPLLFMLFISTCSQLRTIVGLSKVLLYGGIITCSQNILLLINESYIHISLLSVWADKLDIGFGIYDGFIEFASPSLTVAPLLFYFALSHLIINSKQFDFKKRTLIIAIVISAITIIFSGRRAFWLMLPIAPFVIYFFLKITKNRIPKAGVLFFITLLMVIIIVVILATWFDIEMVIDTFMSSFDFVDDESNNLRAEQYNALMEKWKSSPLVGHGLGAYTPKCIRSEEFLWAYELSYVSGLMNYGIIGFAIYACATLGLIYKLLRIIRLMPQFTAYVIPFLSCLLLILVFNASNPYLGKFDYMWTLFIPVLVLNTLCNPRKYDSI